MSMTNDYLKPQNKLGDTQLTLAGRLGDLNKLREIWADLTSCFDQSTAVNMLTYHSNRLGKTVLHEAAQFSKVTSVRFLTDEAGVDADCLKQGDWTPLMLACTKPDLDTVRVLTEAGASTELTNKDGWTPFHIACREGHEDIVSYLLTVTPKQRYLTRSKNGRTPLHTAALYGRDRVVSILLKHHVYESPDDADTCGSTPLMDALRGGHCTVARILIEYGADCCKCDCLGRQAIHLAAEAGRPESIEFLVKLRLDGQCRNGDGLVKHLVDSRTVDKYQLRPCHYAAKEGHVDVLRLLSEQNADLHALDSKGRSCLHMATIGQKSECVEYLISQGLPDSPDLDGIRPSSLARKEQVKSAFDRHNMSKNVEETCSC